MKERGDVLSCSRPRATTSGARRRRAFFQRALPIAALLLGAVGAPTLLLSSGGIARLDRLERQRGEVELDISRLAKRIHHLRSQTRAAKSDPLEIERLARDRLGLVRRTEVVFQPRH